MIQITQVIEYLREVFPNLKIDGAADYNFAVDNSRLQVENQTNFVMTLFVMLGDFNTQSLSQSTIDETYTEQIVILACINNQNDRTGKGAQAEVYLLRNALLGALLNYNGFDTDSYPLQYTHDSMVTQDRARYWHKFVFSLNGRLSADDGWRAEAIGNFNMYTATWYSNDPLADEPIAEDIVTPLYNIPSE